MKRSDLYLFSIRASRRLAALHSDHKRIARGLFLGATFVLLGRLAGAAKEMAIAWRYGVSGIVDAYQLAGTLVAWLPVTLLSIIGAALVPTLVRARETDGAARGRFLDELTTLAVAAGIAFIVIGAFVWPFAIGLLSSGLNGETRKLAVDMSMQLLPISALTFLVGLFALRLQARERHVNTLLEAVPALTLVIMLLLWPTDIDGGPLVLGAILGTALHVMILGGLVKRADGRLGSFRPTARSPFWTEIWKAARILVIGHFALGFVAPIDQFTATHFGDGAIATLGYANRLLALLVSLGVLSIERATLPVFSEALERSRDNVVRWRALKWAWLMVAVGAAIAGLAWIFMPWGVAVLFERGEFTPENTNRVADAARWGLLQLPFYFGGIVLVQLLAARGDYRPIAVSALLVVVVKITVNAAAVVWIGFNGIMLSTAAMLFVSFGYLLYAVSRGGR